MNRVRISTTVDPELLAAVREARSGLSDAALVDEAFGALMAAHRAVEIDAAYSAYDEVPMDTPDAWGDLEAFRRAAAAT